MDGLAHAGIMPDLAGYPDPPYKSLPMPRGWEELRMPETGKSLFMEYVWVKRCYWPKIDARGFINSAAPPGRQTPPCWCNRYRSPASFAAPSCLVVYGVNHRMQTINAQNESTLHRTAIGPLAFRPGNPIPTATQWCIE